MGFDDFFEKYWLADWFINVFKTISPALIALLTIALNEKREKKKEKRQGIKEDEKEKRILYDKALKDMVDSILNLNSMVWDTGKELLDSIQSSSDKEKSENYFSLFYENNKKMLVEARRINGKADIYVATTGVEKFTFNKEFEDIGELSNKFIDILEKYNSKASETLLRDLDLLLDEIQKDLIAVTNQYEDKLIWYCVELNDSFQK